MKNVTISLDEDLLRRARIRALEQGISFNEYMRRLIGKELGTNQAEAMRRLFEHAEKFGISSPDGQPMTRDEFYEGR